MKKLITIIQLLLILILAKAQLTVTEVGFLPENVSNNAVCEGYINDVPYLFSFAGIDETKIYSGIHLRSFRYNIETGEAIPIADLPDTLGKIACAASRINDIIYVSGGYHVFSNNHELSSNKMHRYDIANNVFLADGANIPVATDDHVQAVWRDSLIYLITGWSDVANIPNVQIYNPVLDSWTEGTPVPNNNSYKSFGASGTIVNDTIYYFGGASSGAGFGIQNKLRKGIINPDDPMEISWSISTPNSFINGYRMACTTVKNELHWLGGSNVTYNYNGIAYNGTGGVPPSNRDLYTNVENIDWQEAFVQEIPMDLRGIASINDTLKYLAGGMLSNQTVSNTIYRLEWQTPQTSDISEPFNIHFTVYPNPFNDKISIEQIEAGSRPSKVEIYDVKGQKLIEQDTLFQKVEISTSLLPIGVYFLKIHKGKDTYVKKILKG